MLHLSPDSAVTMMGHYPVTRYSAELEESKQPEVFPRTCSGFCTAESLDSVLGLWELAARPCANLTAARGEVNVINHLQ